MHLKLLTMWVFNQIKNNKQYIILSNANKKYTWFVGNKSTDEDSTLLFSLLHHLHNTLILSFSKYLLSIYYVADTA